LRSITLGIDSSDEFLSVGLVGHDGLILSRSSGPGSHNKNMLHHFMADVMGEANIKMEQLAGVAISLGPGSFTGLRVGLAVAKGICWSLGLPLAGISSLLAVAHCAAMDRGRLVAVKDAKREELYFAAFEKDGDKLTRAAPDSVGPAAEVFKLISDGFKPIGPGIDALRRYDNERRFDLDEEGYDREALGGIVAMLGKEKIAAGETLDVASTPPTYVRTPKPREWKP
jgi:tRNA threonylcarbamoyladenosine biosynthesis protein TsaB